jgi:hypothetical protein
MGFNISCDWVAVINRFRFVGVLPVLSATPTLHYFFEICLYAARRLSAKSCASRLDGDENGSTILTTVLSSLVFNLYSVSSPKYLFTVILPFVWRNPQYLSFIYPYLLVGRASFNYNNVTEANHSMQHFCLTI